MTERDGGPAADGLTEPLSRVMVRHDPGEAHRAATPLELLFDLCFVVAVAQAGGRLVHAVAQGDAGHGVLDYAMIFFAIWWAWMNFTWFASAYDTDDVPHRLITLVQIVGALVLAAGVPRAFDRADYSIVLVGYVVMRLALTIQWLRAARNEQGGSRITALRYAGGVVLLQMGWVGFVFLPRNDAQLWVFVLLAAAELAVPVVAERSSPTPWHPRHIAERYGLFTLIVLGETIAAATVAVQTTVDRQTSTNLLPIAAGGLLIVFAAYWIYFVVPIHEHLQRVRSAFLWGYGHYLIFSSAAAIGAGIEVAIEQAVGQTSISTLSAAAAITIPTAVFVFFTWLLHARRDTSSSRQQILLPLTAAALLACTFAGRWAVLCAGAVAAASVAVCNTTLSSRARRKHAPASPTPGDPAGQELPGRRRRAGRPVRVPDPGPRLHLHGREHRDQEARVAVSEEERFGTPGEDGPHRVHRPHDHRQRPPPAGPDR